MHTLLSGVVQVCHELLVGEEEEEVKEQGRQEEREVKGEGQSEETAHMDDMWMGAKVQDSNLSQMCVWMKCAREDETTRAGHARSQWKYL